MRYLKTNTAVRVSLGPFLDKTDGVTPELALTVSNCKVTVVADTDDNNAPTLILDDVAGNDGTNTLAHIANDNAGYYELKLTASNLNRLGRLTVSVNDPANHCPVFHEFELLTANAYDALVTNSGIGIRSDMQGYLGTAAAAADTAGYAKVTVKSGSGTGEISLTSGQVAISSSSETSIATKVWDTATTTPVTTGTYGVALKPTEHGTATAGAASTITLRAGASAVNSYYNKQQLKIVGGTGAGQSEYISSYVGATKVATMAAAWATQPDNTSIYVIMGGGTIPGASAPTAVENADAVWNAVVSTHLTSGSFGQYLGGEVTRANTAQAGTTTSITLDAGASATDSRYKFHRLEIIAGTGADQASYVSAYNGTSKVASLDPALAVAPSSDSVFILRKLGIDASTPANVAIAVWAATRAGNGTAGSFGEYTNADMLRISGDSTAADNAESFFDGTGYAGTGNVIPSVTTVTGNVNGNVSGSVANVLALAANVITAAATAADFTTEVTAGVATAAALATAQGNITTIMNKTNSLTFTVGGQVDANIQYINDAAVTGIGTAGNPWGP